MLKIILPGISFVLGFFILGLVVYLVGLEEILNIFFSLSPWGLVPLIGFTILVNILSGLKWQRVLRVMGHKIRLRAVINVWLVGYAVSYLTPIVYVGGELVRGYILKERYNVSWKHSLASIAVDKVSESVIWVSTIFLGILILLAEPSASVLPRIISASILALLIFMAIIGVIYIVIFNRKSVVSKIALKLVGLEETRGAKFLVEVENVFFDFFAKKNRKDLIWVFKISVVKYIVLWVRNIFLVYYLLGVLSLGGGMVALGFSYLSYATPIPAALGAQEAVLSAVFSSIGYTSSTGTVITFLLRFAEMLMVGVGLYYLVRWGIGGVVLRLATLAKNNGSQFIK